MIQCFDFIIPSKVPLKKFKFQIIATVVVLIFILINALQGIVFKIPNVDRYPLDLHKLFKVCVCVSSGGSRGV